MHDTRNDEPVGAEFLHIDDLLTGEDRIGHLHRNGIRCGGIVAPRLFKPFVLGLYVDAENRTEQDHGEDDADNAERIGHRISHGNRGIADARRIVIGLLCRTQTGGIGHGTAEDTDHRRELHVRHLPQNKGDAHAQGNAQHRKAVEFQTAFPERREKTRAHLHAHREDEDNEAEILDEAQHHRIDHQAEMTGEDTHEENPRHAQRYAGYLDLRQRRSDGDHKSQQQNRMSYPRSEDKLPEPLHKSKFKFARPRG